MSEDSVYRAFILPVLQAERQKRQEMEQLLEVAKGQVQQERAARLALETRLRQLESQLAAQRQ